MDLEDFKQLVMQEQFQKSAIGAGIGLALWVGLYFLVLAPVLQEKNEIEKQTAENRSAVKRNQALIQRADRIQKEYSAVQAELLTAMQKNLVPTGEYANPLSWVGRIIQAKAEQNELKVTKFVKDGIIRPAVKGRKVPPPILADYRVAIELTGNYHQIGRFFAALEKRLPYGRVDSLQFRPGRSEHPVLSVDMKYRVPMFTSDGFPAEERPQPAAVGAVTE
ncbi:MAG: hypothetical protein R6V56_08420 [Lentisphaeria bacterium]